MAKSSSSYSAPATQKNISKKSFGGRLLPSHGGMIDRGRPRSADQQDGTAYNAQENQNDRDLRADRKRICLRLGAIRLVKHSHDVALFHDEILDAVDLDLGAGPFAEQHPVT